jgi:membrane protein DedA with SNARE-associated domain
LAYVNFRGGVNLAYKYEAGFFARNRDKILLLVIGGAVGAVFGAVLTFLVGYLTGSRLKCVAQPAFATRERGEKWATLARDGAGWAS